jgi:hypothetical protein
MDLQEVTFTDLLQHSNETVEMLKRSRSRALRVRRRGAEEDLVLTTAARATQDKEVVGLAIRLMRAIARDPASRDTQLLEVLPEVFPWVHFLPADDRLRFLREFVDVLSAGDEIDSPVPILQTITEWRNTAQIHADPELLGVLQAPWTT